MTQERRSRPRIWRMMVDVPVFDRSTKDLHAPSDGHRTSGSLRLSANWICKRKILSGFWASTSLRKVLDELLTTCNRAWPNVLSKQEGNNAWNAFMPWQGAIGKLQGLPLSNQPHQNKGDYQRRDLRGGVEEVPSMRTTTGTARGRTKGPLRLQPRGLKNSKTSP